MDDKFLVGVVLGMVGGALLITNSDRMRKIAQDCEKEIKQKVVKMTKPSGKQKSKQE